jgi:hypothetical protein
MPYAAEHADAGSLVSALVRLYKDNVVHPDAGPAALGGVRLAPAGGAAHRAAAAGRQPGAGHGLERSGRRLPAPLAGTCRARIVASYGRRFTAETGDGERLDCVTRGKRGVACGDWVDVAPAGDGGVIERVLARRSLLYRADAGCRS